MLDKDNDEDTWCTNALIGLGITLTVHRVKLVKIVKNSALGQAN